jgi:hypothetical protein
VSTSLAKKVEIPIDVGVGPAANLVTGPVYRDQAVHTGLVFSAEAVLEKKHLRKVKGQIPKQYRDMVMQMNEVRISHFLVPDQFFISPKGMLGGGTGMWGIGFRPIGVNIPFVYEPAFRFKIGAGLRLTYAFLPSDTLPSPTHFLRPGLDLKAEAEVPFSDTFLISFGWNSQAYIPQEVGGPVFAVGALDESVWHIGQAFLKFHVRFPYEYKF